MRAILSLVFLMAACAHPKTAARTDDHLNQGSSMRSFAPPPTAKTDTNTFGSDYCGERRVHFAFNSSEIESKDKDLLERSARCLKNDHKLHFKLEGNADER